MKKKLLLFWTFLLCMVGAVSAEEAVLDFTSAEEIQAMGFTLPENGKGTDITEPFTYKNITITPYKGTNNVRIWNSNNVYTLRYFKTGGAIEISVPEGNKITQIVITGNTQLANTTCDKGTTTMSNSNKTLTWVPDATTETAAKFVNGGSSTTNVETITVTYETTIVTPPAVSTPTITGTTPFFGSTEITMACETEGASIYYTTDGITPPTAESEQYKAPFNIEATTTIQAIAIKGEDKSSIRTEKFVAIPVLTTVAELNALADNTTFRFDGENAIVVAKQVKNGTQNYVYIKDETGSSLIFDKDGSKTADATVGKTLTAGWTGKVSIFNGLFELVPDAALTVNEGDAVEVTYDETPLSDITAENVNKVVTLKGVTYTEPDGSNFNITKGETTVVGYNQFGIEIAAPAEGETYDMVGAIGIYSKNDVTTIQFQPITITRAPKVIPATIDVTEGDIAAAVAAKKNEIEAAGDKVGDITINLTADGNYTVGTSIETAASLVINGNGATVDATTLEAPFIIMSKTPNVENINDFYRVGQVKIANVKVNGIKGNIFYDNNTKYCVVDFTIDNAVLALETATENVSNDALIAFQAGGIKDFTIKNSTVYGNAVAKFFIRYNSNGRIDRYGYTEATDTWSMTYTNNTFYKAIKADGQWGNYNGVAGKAGQMILTINDNIWMDCSAEVMRRLTHSKNFSNFNAASTMANNTFWNTTNNNVDPQDNYGNGTDLITNPTFADAANGNFTIHAGSQQAKLKTGDPRWLVEYDATQAFAIPVTISPATEADITTALNEAKAKVDKVGDITINLAKDGTYTVSGTIETPAGLVINGNNATVDASALAAPFITMSKTPSVENINDFYRVGQVKIANVKVNGIKGNIFYDNNIKYCVVDFTIDNAVLALETATENVSNDALIAFQAGGIKDFTIKNSTVYGNAVAKFFIRYNSNGRIDRYGYTEATDTWSMTYTNNTFYKAIKADGQWGNYNGVAGKAGQMILTINDNIWMDCSAEVMRRLTHSKNFSNFNAASTMANNTFWNTTNNNVDPQDNYGNGTDLITDPAFADAANGDFHIGKSTQQAKFQTGDPRWLVAYEAGDLYKTELENEITAATTLLGDASTEEGTPGADLKAAIEAAQAALENAEFQEEINAALAALKAAEEAYKLATGINEITTGAGNDNGAWYNLQGVRIEKPTQKGIYIHNGKKTAIK